MTAPCFLVEFAEARALVNAQRTLRDDRWAVVDSFSPTPLDDDADIAAALYPRTIPIAALLGGAIGGLGTYALEYFAAVENYPIDVGGRPMNSAIAFLPAALEMTILGAALAAVIAFLLAARLPKFHHPLFDIESFASASDNRFFLLVEDGRRAERDDFHELMKSINAIAVHEVRDEH